MFVGDECIKRSTYILHYHNFVLLLTAVLKDEME